jgi:hypothetical protein
MPRVAAADPVCSPLTLITGLAMRIPEAGELRSHVHCETHDWVSGEVTGP